LLELRKAEQPQVGGNESHHDTVVHFLQSARGVYPVAETFGTAWLPGGGFWTWLDKWEQRLTRADRALWGYMQDQRDWNEHGAGAALIPVAIPVVLDYMPQNPTLLNLGTGGQPTASKGGVRFAQYHDKPASEVCDAYLQLCRQFVEDFLRDHAALL
jgi:hypothetical protein